MGSILPQYDRNGNYLGLFTIDYQGNRKDVFAPPNLNPSPPTTFYEVVMGRSTVDELYVSAATGDIARFNSLFPRFKPECTTSRYLGEILPNSNVKNLRYLSQQIGINLLFVAILSDQETIVDTILQDKKWRVLINRNIEENLSGTKILHVLTSRGSIINSFFTVQSWDKYLPKLVKAGAEIDQPDVLGQTPLYLAAKHMNVVAVRTLLQASLEFKKRLSQELPLFLPRDPAGIVESYNSLIDMNSQLSPLYAVVSNANPKRTSTEAEAKKEAEIISLLLQNDADPRLVINKKSIYRHAKESNLPDGHIALLDSKIEELVKIESAEMKASKN